MKTLLNRVETFLVSEEGPTVTEYAVMLALIILLCFVAITLIGNKVGATFFTLEAGLPDGT
jgi:pilus assembly protein Flp/PilA